MKPVLRASWILGVLLLWGGCKSSHTDGRHWSVLTIDDAPPRRVSGAVGAEPSNSSRHRDLCEVKRIVFSMSGHDRIGDVVAFEVELADPLCREGDIPVRSGVVIFNGHPPGDPTATTGIPSDEWTVIGTVTVDFTKDHHPPRLKKGQQAVAWSAGGSFDLEATHPSGATMTLTAGKFEFDITWLEYEFDP